MQSDMKERHEQATAMISDQQRQMRSQKQWRRSQMQSNINDRQSSLPTGEKDAITSD
jgi:hypothetical protein